MKVYYIHCNNPPRDLDRQSLQKFFRPFGNTTKLYVHPEFLFCKIYFDQKESAERALLISEKPPYYLDLSLKWEEQRSNNIHKRGASFTSAASNSSSMSFIDNEDLYGEAGPTYYNIHGICVPTLIGDDGTLYVALKDVKQIGFELFQEENIPKNINFDKKKIDELKVYLAAKARKYLRNMRYTLSENDIEKAANDTIHDCVSNGTIRDISRQNRSSLPSPSTRNDTKINNEPFKHKQINFSDVNKNSDKDAFPRDKINEPQKLLSPSTHNDTKVNTEPFKHKQTNFPDVNKNSNKGAFPRSKLNEPQKPLRRPTDYRNDSKSPNLQGNGMQNIGKSSKENINTSNVEEENIYVEAENINFTQKKNNFKRSELPLNKPIQVIVSFVNADDKCWVYKKADKNKLEELLFRVNAAGTKGSVLKPFIGQVCASTYRGAWYRAVVREVTPAIKVEYLDFGNFNDEIIKDVRQLPNDVLNEPVLAVQLQFKVKPKTKLEDSVELNITALKKNDDGSFLVEEIVEKAKSNLNTLQPHPAGQTITMPPKAPKPSLRNEAPNGTSTPRSDTPKTTPNGSRSHASQSFTSNKSVENLTDRVGNLTLKEKLQRMKETKKDSSSLNTSSRKSIVDIFQEDNGTLEYVARLDSNTCLAFIISAKFIEEIEVLAAIPGCEASESNFIGKVGDTVAVQKDDEWARGSIVQVQDKQYTIGLIDYGTVMSTSKICQLEQRFVDIPEFTCVCSGIAECLDLLENKHTWDFTSTENNEMQLEENGVHYILKCKRWDPFLPLKQDSDTIFTTAPPFKTVVDGEKVLPVILNEGKLFLRNRDTHILLKEIAQAILDCQPTTLTKEPILGQLVLCPHDTQPNLCRGIVRTLKDNYAEVEFVDYGFTDTVPVKNLRSINESLATKHSSLVPITLKGFEDGEYPLEASECIESFGKSGTKFLAKKCGDNIFDLVRIDGNQSSLSSELKPLSASNNIKYENMLKYTIPDGTSKDLLCVGIEDDYSILFMPNEPESQAAYIELNAKIEEYVRNNIELYTPVLDEVCLAKSEGEWYRARILAINDAMEAYNVSFIDYGDVSTVSSNNIRKIPTEFTELPALAVVCRLADAPNGKYSTKLIEAIKDKIAHGNAYKVQVIRNVEANIYEAKIPELSQ